MSSSAIQPRPRSKLLAFVSSHRALLSLLLAAYLFRAVLLLRGGQTFVADEIRFFRTTYFWVTLLQSNLQEALNLAFFDPAHIAFVFLGILISTVDVGMSFFVLHPPDRVDAVIDNLWMSSLFIALASVAVIALVYGIARRLGAQKREAMLAAFLQLAANSFFYWSRHLVPYDISVALLLFALWIGIKEEPRRDGWRSLIVGLLFGLSLFMYFGNVLLLLVLFGLRLMIRLTLHHVSFSTILKDVGLGLFGGLFWLAFFTALSYPLGIRPYGLFLLEFSETVTQGTFKEGLYFILEYLWRIEGGLLIIWLIGLGLALWFGLRAEDRRWNRGLLLAGATLLLYGLFAGLSLARVFVIYGRTGRTVVPLLCLSAAFGFTMWFRGWKRPRWAYGVLSVLIVAVMLPNWLTTLSIHFPKNVADAVAAEIPADELGAARTTTGPVWRNWGPEMGVEGKRYVLVNAILPGVRTFVPPPEGKVLLRYLHPLMYPHYQYEGMSRERRQEIAEKGIYILLIDTESPAD